MGVLLPKAGTDWAKVLVVLKSQNYAAQEVAYVIGSKFGSGAQGGISLQHPSDELYAISDWHGWEELLCIK